MEKRYGLPTAISMVIGIVIGSGVFIKGGKVLSLTGGNMLQGIAVVGIVGLICVICSLVFAELGSRYEKVNGVVDYAEVALGPNYAYYVGWFMATIYTPAIVAMLGFFSAMMFLQLFGISAVDFANGQINPVAIGVGAGFLMIGYGINILSPKIAGKLQVGMTVIKLIPLLLMGIVGTIAGLINGTTMEVLNFVNTADYVAVDGAGFFKAIVGFAFAYEGWILATSINAELKDAKRNLPLALIGGSVVTIVIYALYIFAMSSVGDVNTIIGTWPFGETLPRIAFSNLFGNVIGTVVYVFITISCLGTMNGLIMASCRGLYALSARGMGPAPEFFGDVDKQNNFSVKSAVFGMMAGGFWYAWTVMMWMGGPGMFGAVHNFEWLAWEPDEIGIICLYVMYIPMMIGLMVKAKDLNPFRRFVLPGLGLCCCLFFCYAIWNGYGFKQCVGFLIVFALFMLVGKIFKNGGKKQTA
ncbi:MAG: APC family permease [Clostridiales bacterium]|nr:APC family permease [Candidatus Cacconaster stercorequi]